MSLLYIFVLLTANRGHVRLWQRLWLNMLVESWISWGQTHLGSILLRKQRRSSRWSPEILPSCLSAACQQRLDLDLQRHLRGQSPRWRERWGADRRRWTGESGRNPFRDVNKIKEPDMIKHEVHHKGNVNLSRILSLSKTVSRRSAPRNTGEFMRPTSSI